MPRPPAGTWFRVGIVKATILQSGLVLAEWDAKSVFDTKNYEAYTKVLRTIYGPKGAYQLAIPNGVRTSLDMRRALFHASSDTTGTRAAAMVAQTAVGRVLGQFILRIVEPGFAFEVFSEVPTARDWLLNRAASDGFDPDLLQPPDLSEISEYPSKEEGFGPIPEGIE